ncbi:MAG TPA: alkaline phosphatase family protein [Candidatus Angelobacter sp.]|nr:alkaline phosphatase family protein [Candidatus Angelobacter sp.]
MNRLELSSLFLSLILACGFLPALAQVTPSQHVYILLEENHSFEDVAGKMPYLNNLASQNVLLMNSYANSHYSIPNYMWLTTGQYVTQDDNTLLTFDVDNIVRHLMTSGKTWKSYQEGLPNAGYTGYNLPSGCVPGTCVYVKRHNPFPYFTDVATSSEALNIMPFTQLATDIVNGTLPNYGFITPSMDNDAHDQPLSVADSWLQTNIGPLLATAPFQPGGDGLLIITWDEGKFTDCRPLTTCPPLPENGGGGRIYTVIIGPQVKHGYQSPTTANHNSILRLMEQALGIDSTGYPGGAATAADLTDIFQGQPAPSPTPTPSPTPAPSPTPTPTPAAGVRVSLSSPVNGTTIPSGQPVQVTASATSSRAITGWRIYANNVNVASAGAGNTLNTQFNLAAGSYTVVVKVWDSTGAMGQQSVGITVATGTPPPGTPRVSISSPASGTTLPSPLVVTASFSNGGVPQYMKVWVDGVARYTATNVASVTTPSIALGAGTHKITVQAYNGTLYSSSETITVH